MRMLKHFESFEPIQSEVETIKKFLVMVYPVKASSVLGGESKLVMIDEKPFYITPQKSAPSKYGALVNKSRLVDALSFELEEHFPLFSEASIRKAAKDFFEFHSK